MTTITDWLLSLRIHTASLTQGALIIGILLAGVQLNSWTTVGWIMFGILYHASGFLNNNIMDYQDDLKDKYKKDHPLVKGTIPYRDAIQLDIMLYFLLAVLGMYLIGNNPFAISLFMIVVYCGSIYNWICKISTSGPFWIAMAFCPLVLLSYATYSSNFDIIIWLVLAYAFAQMWFQIAVEGYLKDIEHDRTNLLKDMGAKVEHGRLVLSRQAKAFIWASKIPMIVISIMMAFFLRSWISLLMAISCSLAVIIPLKTMIRRKWHHDRIVRMCAIIEIVTYFGLVLVLYPRIGVLSCLFLIIYPIMWFMLWNRIYWGTIVQPKV